MEPSLRLSDIVSDDNVGPIAGSLRKFGYPGPVCPRAVAGWLRAKGEDIDTPVTGLTTGEHERRPAQATFRRAVLAAYGGRCAITGCDVEPALDAAHVADWRAENDAGAGLLLRADLHRLLDSGRLVIDARYTVADVPPYYAELRGRRLRLPSNRLSWPRIAFSDAGHAHPQRRSS